MGNAITAIMVHQHADRRKLAMDAVDAFCAQTHKLKRLIIVNSTNIQFSYSNAVASVITLFKPTELSFQIGISQADTHLITVWPDDCTFSPDYLAWIDQYADVRALVYPVQYVVESSDGRCRSMCPNDDRYLLCMPRTWLPGQAETEIPFTDKIKRLVH